MQVTLEHTNSSAIASALVRARHQSGSPAMDMVLTLIVVCDDDTVSDALQAATQLSKEHPARVIGVVLGKTSGSADLNAKVRVGSETSGESILLRMSGPLVRHAESAVLPLLLPDSPVVVWWPGQAPRNPGEDAMGALGTRRLTDAEASPNPVRSLRAVGRAYVPGDTDLSWTRLTPWRALLAAALDQIHSGVVSGAVVAGSTNPVAALLKSWLEDRLDVPITWTTTDDDKIQRVTLQTAAGEICIERGEGDLAVFSVPGAQPRTVPLPTRSLAELLAEDLRRLDADEVYGETIAHLLQTR